MYRLGGAGLDRILPPPDPKVLCAETPDAQVGDPCSPWSLTDAQPCAPTRAQLNADGTVASQIYLRCDGNQCVAAPAPVIPHYLQPCTTVRMEQMTPGVSRIVETGVFAPRERCLFAWDPATQTFVTGKTTPCLGDWSCPEGTLCDDQLGMPGCKPGPRGVLTPSMIVP